MEREIMIAAAVQAYLNGYYSTVEESAVAYGVTKEEIFAIIGEN